MKLTEMNLNQTEAEVASLEKDIIKLKKETSQKDGVIEQMTTKMQSDILKAVEI